MKNKLLQLTAVLCIVGSTTASAIPIISIDLDPTTPGIQSSLSVAQGTMFTIDVVLTGDGTSLFDTFAFDTVFNDLGAILGLTGGTGSPTAGSIAANCPLFCIDFGSGIPTSPGGALTPFPVGPPLPPFTAGSGLVGMISLALPFSPIAAGAEIDLFSITLDALAAGSSAVSTSSGGGLGGLAFAGLPVPFSTASSTVTVTGVVGVPEPGTLALLGIGLFGMGLARRRKQI